MCINSSCIYLANNLPPFCVYPFSLPDVLVWSNDHIQQWVREIGLGDHAHCLNETGVHGGVVALDNDLDHEKLALALQVPLSSFEVHVHVQNMHIT